MIGPARVRHVASATGFREEVVEKVLYLEAILGQLARHPQLTDAWVLKGGTALNLFWLDVPRLSIDIDINYVRRADLDGMRADRPAFEAAMLACCEREGCSVRRAPQEHAGGKFHLRYSGGIGGGGSVEMDVNFLQRLPLLGVEHRPPRFPPGTELGPIPLLTLEETVAGKFAALLTRRAARDAFDVWHVLQAQPDLLERPAFRFAFVVQAGGSRRDLRGMDPSQAQISLREIRDSLLPLLRVEGRPFGGDMAAVTEHVNALCVEAAAKLLTWSPREREFLDRLIDHGEIAAELLTDDAARQTLIKGQPLLRWKALNVRKFRGLPLGGMEEA